MGLQVLASEYREGFARFDSTDRAAERSERSSRLAGPATNFENGALLVHTGDRDEVFEQVIGVRRANPVVHVWHLIEHSPEIAIEPLIQIASSLIAHCVILARTVIPGAPTRCWCDGSLFRSVGHR